MVNRARAETRLIGWIGAIVLLVGSWLGGFIVYHGGAGIDAELVSPNVVHDSNMPGDK